MGAIKMQVKEKGITLLETTVCLALMMVMMAVIVPMIVGMLEHAKEVQCAMNRVQIERLYMIEQVLENKVDDELTFKDVLMNYGKEICMNRGNINYVDGRVICDIHCTIGEDAGEIPYLCNYSIDVRLEQI